MNALLLFPLLAQWSFLHCSIDAIRTLTASVAYVMMNAESRMQLLKNLSWRASFPVHICTKRHQCFWWNPLWLRTGWWQHALEVFRGQCRTKAVGSGGRAQCIDDTDHQSDKQGNTPYSDDSLADPDYELAESLTDDDEADDELIDLGSTHGAAQSSHRPHSDLTASKNCPTKDNPVKVSDRDNPLTDHLHLLEKIQ